MLALKICFLNYFPHFKTLLITTKPIIMNSCIFVFVLINNSNFNLCFKLVNLIFTKKFYLIL